MKKYSSLIILVLTISFIFTTSCQKRFNVDPEEELSPIVKMLTETAWVEKSLSFTDEGSDVTSAYSIQFGDLAVNFYTDGTYAITSTNLGIISSGTWVINNSNTVVTVTDSNNNIITITIISITYTELNLQFTFISTGTINITVDISGTFSSSDG